MSTKTKKGLRRATNCVRTISMWPASVVLSGVVGVHFRPRMRGLTHARRTLDCALGQRLARYGSCTLTLRDTAPRDVWGKATLTMVGIPDGLVVVYTNGFSSDRLTSFVQMCAEYRDRIVGGVGGIRWAKLGGAA